MWLAEGASEGQNDDNDKLSHVMISMTYVKSCSGHAIFIMGVGMSIQYGAWVFGLPSCLTTAY